jgi:hypothetical protein
MKKQETVEALTERLREDLAVLRDCFLELGKSATEAGTELINSVMTAACEEVKEVVGKEACTGCVLFENLSAQEVELPELGLTLKPGVPVLRVVDIETLTSSTIPYWLIQLRSIRVTVLHDYSGEWFRARVNRWFNAAIAQQTGESESCGMVLTRTTSSTGDTLIMGPDGKLQSASSADPNALPLGVMRKFESSGESD